jgi:hypothetical protein
MVRLKLMRTAHSIRRVVALGAVVTAGISTAQMPDAPEPVVPTDADGSARIDVLGEPFLPPGPYPDTTTWAIISTAPDPTAGNEGAVVRVREQGPIRVSVNWANPGDFDLNLAPANPSDPRLAPTDPAWGFQRTASGIVAILNGPPTYAWAPHPAAGVLFPMVHEHGRRTSPDAPVTFSQAHVAGAHGTDRAGAAYSMADGRWRPDPLAADPRAAGNHLWVVTHRVGVEAESFADVGVAWMPYADGWLGGFVTPMSPLLEDLPSPDELRQAHPVGTTADAARILDFGSRAPGDALPWLAEPSAFDVYTEIEGETDLPPGQYTLAASGDDAFVIEIERNGRFMPLAGVPGLHGVATDTARFELTERRTRWRIRHLQDDRGWALDTRLARQGSREQAPLTFLPGSTRVSAWSVAPRNHAPGRWIAADSSNRPFRHPDLADANIEWRIEPEPAAAASAVISHPKLDPDRGVLLATPIINNRSLLAAVRPDDEQWIVQVADAVPVSPDFVGGTAKRWSFAFVFVPFDRPGSVAGMSDSSGSLIRSTPGTSIERLGPGRYTVTLPRGLKEGVPIVQPILGEPGEAPRPSPRFATVTRGADAELVIETRSFTEDGHTVELTDTPFVFAFITAGDDGPPPPSIARSEAAP